jgi:hypothetical protein
MQSYLKVGLLVLSVMSVLILGGCEPAQPCETDLAGSWDLLIDESAQADNLPPTTLSFNPQGNFNQIDYQVGGATITQKPNFGSDVVSGNTVTIKEFFINGSSFNFVGQFINAKTQIKGSLTATLNISSVLSVQFNGVSATMTRQ